MHLFTDFPLNVLSTEYQITIINAVFATDDSSNILNAGRHLHTYWKYY